MKSFLHQYTLSGKIIVPFNTNAGNGVGIGTPMRQFRNRETTMPKQHRTGRLLHKGGIERDGVLFVMEGNKAKEADTEVTRWLRKIGMVK